MRVLADERGVALTWHAAEDVGTPSISPRHIQRVLTNLIGNALTHTPRGGSVEVEAQRLGDVVRVEVRDTGEGIAPADLPHVFERFYRGEPSRSRPPVQTGGTGGTGGMGLGLVIAKALVEAHGGRIGITSEVGRGTTAWFEV
jgi:signal transduction histidine kinase